MGIPICHVASPMDQSETPIESTKRVVDDARHWVARLASGSMTEAELSQFRLWQSEAPEHRRVFERERAFWQQMEGFSTPLKARASPILSRRSVLLGGGAAAAAAAGIVLWPYLKFGPDEDYSTRPGEQLRVSLPDGSNALLNTDTSLAIDYRPGLRNVHLLRGEALFEVRAGISPFRLTAMDGMTELDTGNVAVRILDAETTVMLMAGRAGVSSPLSPDGSPPAAGVLRLSANQGTHYREGGRPSAPIAINPETDLAWRSGRIVFEGKPFDRALADLARYVPERVVLRAGARVGEPVSGVFSVKQANEAIQALAQTQNLTVMRIPGLITVLV